MQNERIHVCNTYCISLFDAPDCLRIQCIVFYFIYVADIVVLIVFAINCCACMLCCAVCYAKANPYLLTSSCVCKNQWDFILCQTFSLVRIFFSLLNTKSSFILLFFHFVLFSPFQSVCKTHDLFYFIWSSQIQSNSASNFADKTKTEEKKTERGKKK